MGDGTRHTGRQGERRFPAPFHSPHAARWACGKPRAVPHAFRSRQAEHRPKWTTEWGRPARTGRSGSQCGRKRQSPQHEVRLKSRAPASLGRRARAIDAGGRLEWKSWMGGWTPLGNWDQQSVRTGSEADRAWKGWEDQDMDRYTVISADCHAGADLPDYRPYLEARLHEEFDRWLADYSNPFRDLNAPEANRNWDSAVRQAALEADGIVAEVVYPNTVPPFFPASGLVTPTPPADEYERRLAGLRAHNRWLSDWGAELPGRRAGIGQILLNDVHDAVDEVNWIADHGLTGGLLLPGAPPGSGLDPLHSPAYDPVWGGWEGGGVVVNVHGG